MNDKEEILYSTPGVDITKNLKNETLFNNCGSRTSIIISGNNMIKFSKCKITLKENTYSYYEEGDEIRLLPNEIKLIKNITKILSVKEIETNNFEKQLVWVPA